MKILTFKMKKKDSILIDKVLKYPIHSKICQILTQL